MRKARDVIGLPVIEVKMGKQLGVAKDLVLADDWFAVGVLVETKQWFSSARYINWDHIVSFGEDAVTVADEDVLEDISESNEYRLLLGGEHRLKDRPVLTVNGQKLGNIEDVYFSDNMDKKIVGCELSDGFISDVTEGRKWLPLPEKVTLGEDAIIVPTMSQEKVVNLFNEGIG